MVGNGSGIAVWRVSCREGIKRGCGGRSRLCGRGNGRLWRLLGAGGSRWRRRGHGSRGFESCDFVSDLRGGSRFVFDEVAFVASAWVFRLCPNLDVDWERDRAVFFYVFDEGDEGGSKQKGYIHAKSICSRFNSGFHFGRDAR